MAYKIEEIEGIGSVYGEKLRAAGIITPAGLLEECATKSGRAALAKDTGINEKLILKWTNHADLFRINGVGPQFSELLEAAGVDTVKEFRNRKAENLYAKIQEVNEAKKLVRRLPSPDQLAGMIEEAGKIEPKMTY
ncbi:MAG: ferredoxin [Bacteroidia bacterium 44-10]|nr:MAG: ferredoxin [Bacteroidia bacterium 44-10]